LNDLNRLQADMLGGDMNQQALEKIVENIKQAPRRNDDPQLQEIIDRIHQRAQIELTKIAMSRRG
jgi:CRISPR/Cas system-associated endoribonuclease Cas2